jgi:ubiquinone/menaquinone biosynthesis C-methylase UbiE
MNAFDRIAGRFEQHRPLPSHVPSAIRKALRQHSGIDSAAPILEVGCGTGRIGSAFSVAGDNYLGVDLSLGMLRAFEEKDLGRRPLLVLADGGVLPFGDRTFEAALMVHLTAARDWLALLQEALRVLKRDGVLAIGRIEGHTDGVDERMRRRLNELIAGLGVTRRSPDRRAAGEWLATRCSRHVEIIAAEWTAERMPRAFILRKESAPEFALLPASAREAALRSLADWAEQSIGPLDTPLMERHHFSLKLYWFEAAAKHE